MKNPNAAKPTPPRSASMGRPASNAADPPMTNSGIAGGTMAGAGAGSTPMLGQIPAGKGTISSQPAHDPRLSPGHPQTPGGAHSLVPGHSPMGAAQPKTSMTPAVEAHGSGGQRPAAGPKPKLAKGSGVVGRAR